MSSSSRIRTLRDLNLLEGSASIPHPSQSSSIQVAHIPGLPQADVCRQLLERIHDEFYPIVQQRGYQVTSLSEFCCCGDGLDFSNHDDPNNPQDHTSNVKHRNVRKRPRTRKKVTNKNVLGYNQSHGQGHHSIHLRMRDANNHSRLVPYESIAGTMAHELAHCVIGPHNASFYQLMDEILEEHAVLLTRGVVAKDSGFFRNRSRGHVLGRVDTSTKATTNTITTTKQDTSRNWMPQGAQKLGGDTTFSKWCTPNEAAAMAAVERRRLLDETWCLPCSSTANDKDSVPITTATVLDLLSSSDDDEGHDEGGSDHAKTRKRPAFEYQRDDNVPDTFRAMIPPIAQTNSFSETWRGNHESDGGSGVVIDLTSEDGKGEIPVEHISPPCWSCTRCTFCNDIGLIVCTVCMAEKDDASGKVICELVRKDAIEECKNIEVERSLQDFGFNIYGSSKKATLTMNHHS